MNHAATLRQLKDYADIDLFECIWVIGDGQNGNGGAKMWRRGEDQNPQK